MTLANNKSKILSVIVQIIFWVIFLTSWMQIGFARGAIANDTKEVILFLMLMGATYFNILYLYPQFFPKKLAIYILSCLLMVFFMTWVEYIWVLSDIAQIYNRMDNQCIVYGNIRTYNMILFRDVLIVGAGTLFLFYRDAMYYYRFQAKKMELKTKHLNSVKNLSQSHAEHLKLELFSQKLQMNEHFLLNVMNSIYSAVLKKSDDALNLMRSVQNLLHHSRENSLQSKISLQDEILFLEEYITLSKARYKDRNVIFDTPLHLENIKVSSMIFDLFVNNAFKYGRNDSSGFIHIRIWVENEHIVFFSCINNMQGFSGDHTSTKKGLYFAQERLKLIYLSYNLDFKIEENCYKVLLWIDTKAMKENE